MNMLLPWVLVVWFGTFDYRVVHLGAAPAIFADLESCEFYAKLTKDAHGGITAHSCQQVRPNRDRAPANIG